jgi:hypothetical protein
VTGPSSYKKRIYRAAVSQRLRTTALYNVPIIELNKRYEALENAAGTIAVLVSKQNLRWDGACLSVYLSITTATGVGPWRHNPNWVVHEIREGKSCRYRGQAAQTRHSRRDKVIMLASWLLSSLFVTQVALGCLPHRGRFFVICSIWSPLSPKELFFFCLSSNKCDKNMILLLNITL